MGLCAGPQISVRRHADAMNRETIQSGDLLPPDSRFSTFASQQPSLGAHPEGLAVLRKDLVNDVACQAAGCRVASPLLVASPLGQSPARHPNPQRALPVLENRIDRSPKTDRPVDLLPALAIPNQQSIGCRQQNPSLGIESGNANHGARNQSSGRKKLGLAGEPHKHSSIPGSHPKIAVTILANHHHAVIRKPAFCTKNLSSVLFPAAQLLTAAVPEGVAVD